ncbi:MAG: hypothetical protein ACKV19_06795 [Verrucomicrobiales bacterium]
MSPSPFVRGLRAVAILGLAAGLSSCLDIDQNLILNPDGSGKVTLTAALSMGGLEGLGGLGDTGGKESEKKLKPREQAREVAVTLLRAEGIEAWSDVSYGVGKDGKTRASVTGLFPDVTKVRLSTPMDEDGEKDDLGVSRTSDGHWLLEDSLEDDPDEKPDEAEEALPATAPLSDEEVQDKLDEERQQWAAMKVFMNAFLESFRIGMTVQGGGTIVDTQLFEKKDDRTATFEFTGKKLLAGLDAILQDDDKAKALIRRGISPTDQTGGSSELMKVIFGGDGKMRLKMKPGDPAFDYAAAVAKAKADESPELRALLEDAKKPAKKSSLRLSLPGLNGEEEAEEGDGEETPDELDPTPPRPRRID